MILHSAGSSSFKPLTNTLSISLCLQDNRAARWHLRPFSDEFVEQYSQILGDKVFPQCVGLKSPANITPKSNFEHFEFISWGKRHFVKRFLYACIYKDFG
jgi:hypothetical protein